MSTARSRPTRRWVLSAALSTVLLLPVTATAQTLPDPAAQLVCAPVPDSDDRCETWAAVHDPDPDPEWPYQFGTDLATSADGALVVAAGYGAEDLVDTGGQARSSWRLVGLDEAGTERWTAQPGPADAYARPLDVVVAADATTAYATGFAASAFGSGDASLLVTAVDAADGTVRWTTEVTPAQVGGGAVDVRGWRIGETAGGGLVVIGTYGRPGPERFQGLLSLTLDRATGDVLGLRREPQPVPGGVAYPVDMAVAPDGTAAFVGAVADGFGQYDLDFLGIAVDLTDLAAPAGRWTRRLDGIGSLAPDRIEGVALDPAGERLYLTGISSNDADGPPFAVDYAVQTVALDTGDGTVAWSVREDLGDGQLVIPSSLAADDELVAVVGSVTTATGSREGLVRGYSAADGEAHWVAPVTAAGLDNVTLADVAVDRGSVVVTGSAHSSTVNTVLADLTPMSDTLTAELDAVSGERRWTARWNATTTGADRGARVVLAPGGRAYVLSSVTRNVEMDRNFYDLGVLAYDVG